MIEPYLMIVARATMVGQGRLGHHWPRILVRGVRKLIFVKSLRLLTIRGSQRERFGGWCIQYRPAASG
jgi:hypothetical protein